MPKNIFIIESGATTALMEAALSIISRSTGGLLQPVVSETADSHAIVVGPNTPKGVYTSVVLPPSKPHTIYTGVRTIVMRSILPRQPSDKLQIRDILDVYPSSSVDCTAEEKLASSTFAKAAQLAVQLAKEQKASRLTLVIKPASKYKNLNDIFLRSVIEVAEARGLPTEVIHTAKAANELVIFPEKYSVVLTNDDPVCENVQRAFAGVLGGAPEMYYTEGGGCIMGGASYKSVALAIAQELKNLGMLTEAEKVLLAAGKDARKVAL